MASGYQTSGETARRGTHVWPNTGGGWMNDRGDDMMTMFQEYAQMVDFFTSFDWWARSLTTNSQMAATIVGQAGRH
jgi:hypothetical protein